jgi:hypothetical protein
MEDRMKERVSERAHSRSENKVMRMVEEMERREGYSSSQVSAQELSSAARDPNPGKFSYFIL